jgi:hypothetical protein
MKCNGGMYNLYNKNRTDDLGGKSEEGVDFYIPIGAILVELQDCSNKLTGIESNNSHIIGPDSCNTSITIGTMTLFRFRR